MTKKNTDNLGPEVKKLLKKDAAFKQFKLAKQNFEPKGSEVPHLQGIGALVDRELKIDDAARSLNLLAQRMESRRLKSVISFVDERLNHESGPYSEEQVQDLKTVLFQGHNNIDALEAALQQRVHQSSGHQDVYKSKSNSSSVELTEIQDRINEAKLEISEIMKALKAHYSTNDVSSIKEAAHIYHTTDKGVNKAPRGRIESPKAPKIAIAQPQEPHQVIALIVKQAYLKPLEDEIKVYRNLLKQPYKDAASLKVSIDKALSQQGKEPLFQNLKRKELSNDSESRATRPKL